MSEALQWEYVSPEDYLRAELQSEIRHEYREGVIYAMAGATIGHNRVAMNAALSLGNQLRGSRCRPFNSDTKVRIKLPRDLRFYYPDLQVNCRPTSDEDQYLDEPSPVLEVLSPSTRRIDLGEKKDAYLMIPSLDYYLAVEVDPFRVIAWERQSRGGFEKRVYEGKETVIDLPTIGAKLTLEELYSE